MQCDNATDPHAQTAAPPPAAAAAAAPVDYEARYRAQRAAAAAQVSTRYWKGHSVTICHSERRVSGRGGAGRAAVRALPLAAAGQARLRRAGGDGAIISLSSHHAVLSSYLASVSHHVIHAAHQLVGMPSHHAVSSCRPITPSSKSRRHAHNAVAPPRQGGGNDLFFLAAEAPRVKVPPGCAMRLDFSGPLLVSLTGKGKSFSRERSR